jgi:hypothetical protein
MEGEGLDFGDSFPVGSTELGEALQTPHPGEYIDPELADVEVAGVLMALLCA